MVSMKSGLEDRNNSAEPLEEHVDEPFVSMKSGLEDRNNVGCEKTRQKSHSVSMKSGLEDRNNPL